MERFMWMLKLYCSIMDPHIPWPLHLAYDPITEAKYEGKCMCGPCACVCEQEYKKGSAAIERVKPKKMRPIHFYIPYCVHKHNRAENQKCGNICIWFYKTPIPFHPLPSHSSSSLFLCVILCLLVSHIALVYGIIHIGWGIFPFHQTDDKRYTHTYKHTHSFALRNTWEHICFEHHTRRIEVPPTNVK